MKRTVLFYLLLFCAACLLFQCVGIRKNKERHKPNSETEPMLVGSDRDTHGCIASAGYQWSELLQACVRPFERGHKLQAVGEDSTIGAYILENADHTKVEVFLPNEPNRPILERSPQSDGACWTNPLSSLHVRFEQGVWKIFKDQVLIYME